MINSPKLKKMDVLISELVAEEIDECAALFSEAFGSPPWNQNWSRSSAFERLKSLYVKESCVGYKAIVQERICGFVMGEVELWNSSQLFLIKELCVAVSHQRRGIGRQIIETLLNQLPREVEKVYLLTDREGPARLFYESMGFSISEQAVVMGKVLHERS